MFNGILVYDFHEVLSIGFGDWRFIYIFLNSSDCK